ncbi:thioester reductase domain-containing protein [Paenibacillus tepidiphilus]|uniref:thioester reductase domain-containing protein n=1 Tax=Paenibacillus tepidiphilus TaxID=2608683 RepID=UPI00123859E5|nr:thioester reductase domain-containing protein [Paenibacillus tepidiphilus]
MSGNTQEIVVLASFTANLLETFLAGELQEAGIPLRISTGPYNQIISQCMDEESALYRKQPEVLLVWTRLEDILSTRDFYRPGSLTRCKQEISMLLDAVLYAKQRLDMQVIFMLPAMLENRPLGAGDYQVARGAMETSLLLRAYMLERLRSVPGVLLADAEDIIRRYGAERSANMGMYAFAKIPYVNRIFKEAAGQFRRLIALSRRTERRVLLLDAGVLLCESDEEPEEQAEQGPAGMLQEIDGQLLADDDAYRMFHAYLQELRAWGAELALCTKSGTAQVQRILAQDSVLPGQEDFTYICAECGSIAEAMNRLEKQYGLVREQIVVLDTRELGLAEGSQVRLPEDPALWMQTVEASGVLDFIPDGAEFYEDAGAGHAEEDAPGEVNLEQFLQSIALEVSLRPADAAQAGSLEHLLHGTKDFNLTGRTFSSADLLTLMEEQNAAVYAVKVADRFGDYGIAGAVIGTFSQAGFTVDNLLLNCRVLGKNAEYILVKQLAETLQAAGYGQVKLRYEPNGRNEMAARFLAKLTRTGLPQILAGETAVVDCRLLAEYADEALLPKEAAKAVAKVAEPTAVGFDPYAFIAGRWNRLDPAGREQLEALRSSTPPVAEIMQAIFQSKARTRVGLQADYIEPRTDTERSIAGLWADILNLDQVGVLDNFFGLGGTSLMAAQLIVKFKNAFGIKLPVRIFFDNSSVEQMALYIDAIRAEQDKEELNESAVSNFRYKTREFLRSEVWLDESITGIAASPNAGTGTALIGQPREYVQAAGSSAVFTGLQPGHVAGSSAVSTGLQPGHVAGSSAVSTGQQFGHVAESGGVYGASGTAPALQTALLTGGTGFLGAFLLQELLEVTDYRIVLLVRAASVQDGRAKAVANMRQYGLWNEAYNERIDIVAGDLSRPLLGLGLQQFNRLAVTIDVIYHAGAITNFLEPYRMIKDVNVQGTQEILRLAAAGRLKPVHYVSTHYVFSNLSHGHGFVAYEDDVPTDDEVLVLGYQQSKWVAEQILAIAKQRGIPVSIYRVGRISGSSVSGACQTKDIMWLMIKCCVEAGILFEENVNIEFIPVDYVSRSIVALSVQESSRNTNFHITGNGMNNLQQVYEWMSSYGFQVEKMSYDRWKDELVERAANHPEMNTVKAMLPFIPEDMGEWDVEVVYDTANRDRGLQGTGIACPPVEAEIFRKYLDYFVETQYFQLNH